MFKVSSFSSLVAALRIPADDGCGLFVEPEEGVAGRVARVEIGDAGVVAWSDAIHGEVHGAGCCGRCGEDIEEEKGERGEGEWEGARHWEMGAGKQGEEKEAKCSGGSEKQWQVQKPRRVSVPGKKIGTAWTAKDSSVIWSIGYNTHTEMGANTHEDRSAPRSYSARPIRFHI